AQLKEMADATIAARQRIASDLDALKSSKQRLEEVVTSIERRKQDSQERLQKLKLALSEIDAKAVALKSIHDASTITDASETLDFEHVERQVQDLSSKIDVELAFQDEKWSDAAADDVQS